MHARIELENERMIQIEGEKYRRLINMIASLPEMSSARGRKHILIEAGLNEFIHRIDLSGPSQTAVGEIVTTLINYGSNDKGQPVLGALLATIKSYVGIEQKSFLEELLSEPDSKPNRPERPDEKKVILILSANPQKTNQLRLSEEIREIKEGLKRSKYRDKFKIETGDAVRYRDIHRALLDYEPNILHFSGHGAAEEGLVFEDEVGNSFFVDANALGNLFKIFKDKLECVVLNACFSEIQARAIVEHIPYAIGMNKAIGDRAAINFAVGFYDALGAGRNVDFAYQIGCSAIVTAGISENLTPQLLEHKFPNS